MAMDGWGCQGDHGRSSGLASSGFEGGAQGLPGGKLVVGRGRWGHVSGIGEIEATIYGNLEGMGSESRVGHSVMPGLRKEVLGDGDDQEERNESPGFVFLAKFGDVGVPSNKREGDPRDSHDSCQLGGGGKGGEELKLSHKEITGLLKSTLQVAGTMKEGRMNLVGLLECSRTTSTTVECNETTLLEC